MYLARCEEVEGEIDELITPHGDTSSSGRTSQSSEETDEVSYEEEDESGCGEGDVPPDDNDNEMTPGALISG